jgi:moderate conductance mechanosensitive channel
MTDWLNYLRGVVLARAARVTVLAVAALVLNRLLRAVTRRMIARTKEEGASRRREQQTRTVAGLVYSAGTALIIIVVILLALPEFGFNVTPVAAAAGLASLALGFGGQYLVRDVINGFFIVFEDQYVVGDVVRIGDRVGRVEHLTLRRTLLRDQNGALVTIPNGMIGQVSNLGRQPALVWVDVTVASEESAERALRLLDQVLREYAADPAWAPLLNEPPQILGIEQLSAAGTLLRIQAQTAPLRQDDVARELRRRISSRFEQEGIRSSPSQRVEIVPAPPHPMEPSR